MRKQSVDFKSKTNNIGWYDLVDDWDLIEASLAKQYGIRMRQQKKMPWTEFCTLVGGLMSDTPLGQIISIRSESDPKTIKNFNSVQKKIHNDWRLNQANSKLNNPEQLKKQMDNLEKIFENMFK